MQYYSSVHFREKLRNGNLGQGYFTNFLMKINEVKKTFLERKWKKNDYKKRA